MKGFFKAGVCFTRLILWIIFSGGAAVHAQQNNTLFFMHSLPEANYLNPAVQSRCNVFIGLPVISSFHMNIANSGFSAGKLVTLYTDGTVRRKSDARIPDFPRRKYFLTEFHSVLLAVGIKRNDLYYNFTITEKNNSFIGYTSDLMAFSLRGSNEFEGQILKLAGTRVVFNHLREYAFGISKNYSSRLTLGAKVKLLFGKFNFNTGNSSFGVFIEEGSQDILFDIDGGYNSSLPYALQVEGPGQYRFMEVYEASLIKHMMNSRNYGLAVDLGFIYQYDDRWKFSGSLLDAGFIWYRSNLSNYTLEGNQRYQGPFADGTITDQYLWDVFDEWNATMDETLTADPYVHFMDPRLYLGASRKLNDRYDLNFLLYNRLLPGKLQTGTTLSLLTRADKAFRTSISWSYMNNSFTNLGLGISYGRNPVQLYFVTDNIFGFILPLSTKNVNLRLGINLNLGCRESISDINNPGCSWLSEKRIRKARLRSK